jgi:dephospho-CoA kinase
MRWPILKTTLLKIAKAYFAGYTCIVVDAPLLFEAGMDKLCSATVTVFIEKEEDQIKRLLDRDAKLLAADSNPNRKPLTEAEAKDRIHAQMSIEEKRRRSTYELDNSTTIQDLENQIDVLVSNVKSKHRAWIPRNSLIVYLVTLFFLTLMYLSYRFAN